MTHLPHPTASPNHFSGLAPILNVSNIPRSIDFYVNLLGFQQDWAWGDPPTFASVSRDDVCIFLCQGAQGQSGMWLSIFVHDVDALYAMYKDKDVNIRQAPTNFAWGMREMNIEDPDGHRLRIGTATDAPSDGIPLCES